MMTLKQLKALGVLTVLLLLINGCGTDEPQHGNEAEVQKSSINSGVKQVESQKITELQDGAQQNGAEGVDAAEAESSGQGSQEKEAGAREEHKKRSEVQSSDEPTPERTSIHTIVIQNKYGKVALNHAAHTEFISCSTCHPTEPPSRIELSRKEFHNICRTCHHEMGAGPVKCSGCHEH